MITSAPLAIVMTRLRTDPLNRWRSDPETGIIRELVLESDRRFDSQFVLRLNARAADQVLNDLAGVTAATSNRRLIGDPRSTARHAVDGDPATAWTSPFSDVVGSTLSIPLIPTEATSALTLTQPVDQSYSIITKVTVTIGDTSTTLDVPTPDGDGRSSIEFPPARSAAMTLRLPTFTKASSIWESGNIGSSLENADGWCRARELGQPMPGNDHDSATGATRCKFARRGAAKSTPIRRPDQAAGPSRRAR